MISEKMKEKISKLALRYVKTQADTCDLTYLERISTKVEKAKEKALHQAQKFTPTSKSVEEEADELNGYLLQYIENLVEAEGLSEEDALARAVAEFEIKEPDAQTKELEAYYQHFDPATQEVVGLMYASRILVFGVIGAMLGLAGQYLFDHKILGLIFVLMIFFGILFGTGVALSDHSKIVSQRGR